MSKKLAVITGSPRRGGNSSAMADSFVKAAEAKGHAVTRFDAGLSEHLGGCRGCETCYSKGTPCSFDDDFNKIAPAIAEADGVIFVTPVYWYSFPAQIKCVLDKMFCFMIGGVDIKGKECALIACCEEDDVRVMDGLVAPLEKAAALMKWNVVGHVLVPSVFKIGDIDKTDGCAKAAALADKF